MATKKIRVHELARELGLTNKETLDLSVDLGIGVKSHSSSIEDPQADRVRRKADQLGIRRDVQPDEPKKDGAPPPAVAEVAAPPAPPQPAVERPVPPPPSPVVPAERPAAAAPRPAALPSRPAAPPPRPTPAPSPSVAAPPPPRPAATPPSPPPFAPPPGRAPVTAGGGRNAPPPMRPVSAPAPPRPVDAPVARSGDAPATPRPPQSPPRPGAAAGPGGRPAPPPQARPMSPSGKPIPPPPGQRGRPQMSPTTGRPIPPPPGLGGRSTPPGSRPGGPAAGGPTARPGYGGGMRTGGAGGVGARPGYGGGARPGGPPGAGSAAPGGRPGGPGGPGGYGGRPGGPGGGGFGGRPGGGPGGRGRPQRGRRRKRRLSEEDLKEKELTRYSRVDAPIPEGEIVIERGSTAQDIAPKLNRTPADVLRFLLQHGEMVTATVPLSDEAIEVFASELGAEVVLVEPGTAQEAELALKYFDDEDDPEELLKPRPPVVTVMGHVDHGKTTLLDKIRKTNVVAGEAGGITQHIGAYQVDLDGRAITFIDTPGHAAFTQMRARGAQVTDIVILVVAADDGVMPQTREAIAHAQAAEVPIVVAINRMDREDANPDRVKQQLAELGLNPEDWGGEVPMVPISALRGDGVSAVLEQVLLQGDIALEGELLANPDGKPLGAVLEANLDVGRGPVATVIVENGTIRVGDFIVAGSAWGKVRALIDDKGKQMKAAGPSTPVRVLGFNEPPSAGDEFRVTKDQATARTIGELRANSKRFREQRSTASVMGHVGSGAKLEDIFDQIQSGGTATLNLIVKADVQGSLEAVTESLRKLERDEVKLSFVHRAVGGITENDVQLAAASNATIIGFNVRPDRKSREAAERVDVEIRTYEIIYKLLEDVESAIVGMLAPEFEEVITGEAECRQIFTVPKIGAIAGCYVRSGVITRGSKVRFLRDGVIIWKGAVTSLRRFKDDAREVAAGFECGIGLTNNQDLRPGDIIETFDEREIPRT